MGKLGNLAGALSVMGALTAPAAAQEQTDNGVVLAAQTGTAEAVTDCVGFVRGQQELQQEIGVAMSRSEIMTLLAECRGGILDERIAEQKLILVSLGEQIQQLDLRLDDQARIIDANNQEIARIVTINGQLIIRRAEVQADTEQMLDEAERILQSLATS